MGKQSNITNAELKVMKQVWAMGRMVTVPEMVDLSLIHISEPTRPY